MNLIARATMYGLLTEMENDFRAIVDDQLRNDGPPENILHPDLHEKTVSRFQKERPTDSQTLRGLLDFADLGDLMQILRTHKNRLSPSVGNVLRAVGQNFEPIVPIRNRVMHGRPLSYSDLATVSQFTDLLLAKVPASFPQLKDATDTLKKDPTFFLRQPLPTDTSASDCYHNLPFPEFDETGFVGREEDLKRLHRHIRGPYPVLSVLGEGGIGKTSLALKAAYELLDDPDNPYKAIIWATSKSAQLTPHDIKEIDNAIKDSAALLMHAASNLAGAKFDEPIDEIHAYMRAFPVMLILDNLENVLDDRIRNFLEGIPNGTKIVLTSRIGLQAGDQPITLRPMAESVDLLKAVADARGVKDLTRANHKQLEVYCRRLHQNPLAIKWFVSAVQHGTRPEDVLREQGPLLDYCMSNVYQHLTEDSKLMLSVFQTINKPLSLAHLVAYSDLDAVHTSGALLQLDAANMIMMRSVPSGRTYETTYSVTQLALTFLNAKHPVKLNTHQLIRKRVRQLTAMVEAVRRTQPLDPFSIRSIRAKSEAEVIVAGILLSALNAVSGKITPERLATADDYLKQAKSLAPEYFEVHRIAGYINYKAGRINEAFNAYQTAIEIRPDEVPLRLWYAQVLMKEQDLDGARVQLDEAMRLSPDSPRIELEYARLRMYHGEFAASRSMLTSILGVPGQGDTYQRQAHDLIIQTYIREGEQLLDNRKPAEALSLFEAAKDAFDLTPGTLMDGRMKKRIIKAIPSVVRVERVLREGELGARAQAIKQWCLDVQFAVSQADVERIQREGDIVGASVKGVVKEITGKGFGFIAVADRRISRPIFFMVSGIPLAERGRLRVGAHIEFVVGADDNGRLRAENPRVL